jgi:hypothetical protein
VVLVHERQLSGGDANPEGRENSLIGIAGNLAGRLAGIA